MENTPLKIAKAQDRLETEQLIRRALQSVFDEISKRTSNAADHFKKINAVVAFSGGCDSVCLLRSLSSFKDVRKGNLTAVYVHHGLSPNADEWAKFTKKVADDCGVGFVLKKVALEHSGLGIEAEARRLRYLALEEAARELNAQAIVTAHHRDDQLETFLIQWMRGAGIEGLAAMPAITSDLIPICRPFLNIGRKELEEYAKSRQWEWIEDESNADTAYLRNLIRLEILPVLDRARPGFRKAAARSVQLVAESAQILKAADEEELQKICSLEGKTLKLRIADFYSLDAPKKSRLLRHWLRSQDIHQVPKRHIDSILRRLDRLELEATSRLMELGDKELLATKGFLLVRKANHTPHNLNLIFRWSGEKEITFSALKGRLLFQESNVGFPQEWLKAQPLSISLRRGKDRIKTGLNSPAKLVKVLCQEAGLDRFERERIPIVRRAGQIIYVAKLGAEVRSMVKSNAGGMVSLKWIEDEDRG